MAFTRVPAAAILNGSFELRVRLNDARGVQRQDDDTTVVSVRASGGGQLGGTLQRPVQDGFVRFDDLRYDRWETITLIVSAAGELDAATPAFPVRPVLRFGEMPPARTPVDQPVGPFVVELVDALGALLPSEAVLTIEATDPHAIFEGGRQRPLGPGRARFDAVTLQSIGTHTVSFALPGIGPLAHGLMSFSGDRTESLWLPPGRIQAPYRVSLPAGQTEFRLTEGQLPAGMTLEPGGAISGVPTEPGRRRFKLASLDPQGVRTTWVATLLVAASVDTPGPELDSLDRPGPHEVRILEETVVVPSRRVEAKLRVLHPALEGLGAQGNQGESVRLPLVAFHHGAARLEMGVRTLHDQYDPLLRRWASHGFVVASIDGTDLVYSNRGYLPLTLGNLSLMSENLRATVAHLRARDRDASFALAGRIDFERVVLGGHSRGAGAAIIAAQASPGTTGLVLLKPIDPMIAFGGDMIWNRPLPPKPMLMAVAGNDADVVYPAVDFLYERRSAPVTSFAIPGSIHAWSCASCPAERGAMPEVTREHDWAVTNAYTVAFLRYLTGDEPALSPVLFGRRGLGTALSPLGAARYSDRGAQPLVVDDFQQDAPTNTRGQAPYVHGPLEVRTSEWAKEAAAPEQRLGNARLLYLRPEIARWARARVLRWTGDGAVYGNPLGPTDLRPRSYFAFRARSLGPAVPASALQVRLADEETSAAAVAPVITAPGGIGPRTTDVMVPLQALGAQGLPLEDIERVEILLAGSGTIVIDDLRFE